MGEWGRARLRALVTVVLLGTVGLVATLVALTAAGGDRPEPVPADSVPADSVPADATAAGRRYTVSPAGADDADGSTTRPWRTLGHALERLRPGDTLVVGAGTYEEDLDPDLTSGRPDARITVTGEEGAWPVVKGLVRLRDPDYWTVRGLELTWGGGGFDDHMVKVVSGTGWVLERLRIHGSRSRAGLLIAGSTEDGPPGTTRCATASCGTAAARPTSTSTPAWAPAAVSSRTTSSSAPRRRTSRSGSVAAATTRTTRCSGRPASSSGATPCTTPSSP